MKETLVGKYKRRGNRLIKIGGNIVLLWKKRKKDRGRKPEDFLLLMDEAGKYKAYLSSLYPLAENKYRLDDRQNNYILTDKGDVVEISGLGTDKNENN